MQANKAGLMEIADVFVINKADRAGVDETRRDLEQMLELSGAVDGDGWRPPIVAPWRPPARASTDLWRAVADHRAHIEATGELARRRAARARRGAAQHRRGALEAWARAIVGDATWAGVTDRVASGELDAWSGADLLLGE